MKKILKKQAGFTLIEILIVIGIIAVLAAIVLVAVNPARQFAQANNADRSSDLNALLSAVGQMIIDDKGTINSEITTTVQDISSAEANLCADLMPDYIPSMPQDPSSNNGVAITSCTTYNTGYTIVKDANGRITIAAPDAQIGATITVTR